MTTEQVPIAAQIEKVRREIHYAQVGNAPRAERLWSAVLATLQQHGRAMAALRAEFLECAVYDALMEGPQFRTWNRSSLDRLRKKYEALAALDDAASAAATPAGKPR